VRTTPQSVEVGRDLDVRIRREAGTTSAERFARRASRRSYTPPTFLEFLVRVEDRAQRPAIAGVGDRTSSIAIAP
jgi:hypothetical protein